MLTETKCIILLLVIGESLSEICDPKACTGPHKIVVPPTHPPDSRWHEESAQIVHYKPTVKGTIGMRMSYKAYCYEGGALDSNSGCTKTYTPMGPNEEDLKIWSVKNKCSVGITSAPGSEYWGSDAKPLWEHNPPTKWVQGQDFTVAGIGWSKFAFHTTVYDWSCSILKTEFPLLAGYNESFTLNGKGVVIPILSKGAFQVVDSSTSVILDPAQILGQSFTQVYCVSSEKYPNLCSIKENTFPGEEIPTVFEMHLINGQYVGWEKNLRLIVPSITSFTASPTTTRWTSGKGVLNEMLGKAASIEDLIPIIHNMMLSKEETDYNTVQILRVIQDMQERLVKIVLSVGKVDEHAIPAFLNSNSKVKWLTDKLFYLCPCFVPLMDEQSTCTGDYYFQNGYIKQGKSETCVSLSNRTILPKLAFNSTHVVENTLTFPPPLGASGQWEGWSWVEEKKDQIRNSIEFSNTSTIGGGPLSYFGGFSSASLQGFFSFFLCSSSVSYLALLLAFIALIRR